ncbi:DUF4394 domain-containing protein [Streptomyces sp. B22F1]|uniref:DUF4394 domain-containing protein n=1 Tax=Streptomyces sp. B22F1 TaxID=3153566 RepID=UPI00325D3FE9
MTGIKKRAVAAVAALSAVATLAVAAPAAGSSASQSAAGLRGFGISSDGTLMTTFTTDRHTVLDWVRGVTGRKGATALLGIDERVQDGTMYGLGDQGGVYTISTPPQTPGVVVTKVSQLQVPRYGKNVGFDFNPAADRLRVVSDNGQNLRHHLKDHTTVWSGAAAGRERDTGLRPGGPDPHRRPTSKESARATDGIRIPRHAASPPTTMRLTQRRRLCTVRRADGKGCLLP